MIISSALGKGFHGLNIFIEDLNMRFEGTKIQNFCGMVQPVSPQTSPLPHRPCLSEAIGRQACHPYATQLRMMFTVPTTSATFIIPSPFTSAFWKQKGWGLLPKM